MRVLANGEGMRLVPNEFIIHFGLEHALLHWFEKEIFWRLRAQHDSRSQLDFWSGKMVHRMDMACDGKVLHEVESMPPSQTTQNTPEDATWKERHGMCVEIGHDHFPIFKDRKR